MHATHASGLQSMMIIIAFPVLLSLLDAFEALGLNAPFAACHQT